MCEKEKTHQTKTKSNTLTLFTHIKKSATHVCTGRIWSSWMFLYKEAPELPLETSSQSCVGVVSKSTDWLLERQPAGWFFLLSFLSGNTHKRQSVMSTSLMWIDYTASSLRVNLAAMVTRGFVDQLNLQTSAGGGFSLQGSQNCNEHLEMLFCFLCIKRPLHNLLRALS